MSEDSKILQKILKCVYIIIVLLAINTIILFASNVKITTDKDKSKDQNQKGTEEQINSNYDVSMFKEVTMDEAIDLFDSKETKLIYIGRATCGYCIQFLPALQQAQTEYGYQTYYYDMDKLTSEDSKKILEKDNEDKFLGKNFTATPMVLLVKNGKLQDTWVGYDDYEKFAQFLEKNGFEK